MFALIVCSTVIAQANDYNFVYNKIIENYYTPLEYDVSNENFYSENNAILANRIINEEKSVAIYETKFNLSSKNGFNNFIEIYNMKKSLDKALIATNSYFTMVYDKCDKTYSTALINKENNKMYVGAIYKGDNGFVFNFPNDKDISAKIDKYCNINTIHCKFVIINGVGSGILISDGKQELIDILSPAYYVPIEPNTLYTVDEFINKLVDIKNSIIYNTQPYKTNPNGELNYIIG